MYVLYLHICNRYLPGFPLLIVRYMSTLLARVAVSALASARLQEIRAVLVRKRPPKTSIGRFSRSKAHHADEW
jgi:hypothetical protein